MCVLFVIITLFLVTEGWKLLIKKIIGISFVRNVIFIENSLFLKMMPGGFKKSTSWQPFTDQYLYTSISVFTKYAVYSSMNNYDKMVN